MYANSKKNTNKLTAVSIKSSSIELQAALLQAKHHATLFASVESTTACAVQPVLILGEKESILGEKKYFISSPSL